VSALVAHLGAAWHDARAPRLALPSAASVTFGRSRDCDCVVADPTVSRRHASLRLHDGAWLLRDLRSANGTLVNGWRVLEEVEVRPGDRVTFGAVTYRLGAPR
jgi:pSer/pThr/pTyr-binding forkhead associated (FHA) protein